MQERLIKFNEVKKLYKFHGIDQKIVNKLKASLSLKKKEIEKLTCKKNTLEDELKKPD